MPSSLYLLQPSTELGFAARDHVNDMIQNDLLGHEGSDGSTLQQRIERYTQWRGAIGENARFGYTNPTELIVNLLIDDGLESKGQRLNLLSKDFHYVGSYIGPHKAYRSCCVLNFASAIVAMDMIVTCDMTKHVTTIADLTNSLDVARILSSIPYSGDLRKEIHDKLVEGDGIEVILEFLYDQKTAKISYKKGTKTTRRTLTWK